MKLSWFVAILIPGVSAFVKPSTFIGMGENGLSVTTASINSQIGNHGNMRGTNRLSMTASHSQKDDSSWNVSSFFRGMLGTASDAKAKADTTASEVYAELKKKVLVKQERQCLEGQLCSLLRIGGDSMSCKSEEHVRRLASELEALQPNANAFGVDKVSLAGSWKLLYTSVGDDGRSIKSADKLCSVEHISYVSENYRISHTDCGVLKVYKRVGVKPKRVALYTQEDDTATAAVTGPTVTRSKVAGKRASKGVLGGGAAKQPLRKRMFFGWRRR